MGENRWIGMGLVALAAASARGTTDGAEIIPPLAAIKPDHPRVLLRPRPTPYAISLEDLRAIPRDADAKAILAQLRRERNAAAQAMVWLLTGDRAAAAVVAGSLENAQVDLEARRLQVSVRELGETLPEAGVRGCSFWACPACVADAFEEAHVLRQSAAGGDVGDCAQLALVEIGSHFRLGAYDPSINDGDLGAGSQVE